MLGANGYPTGAPREGCSTMIPGHGVPAQTGTTNPYQVITDKTTFSCPGDTITVSIRGNSLRGFLCRPMPNTGEFEMNQQDPVRKQNKCSPMVSFTHVDNSVKSGISFNWQPETTQSVNIVCTVVQSKLNFWVNVSSSTLKYIKGNCRRPTPGPVIPEQGGRDAEIPGSAATNVVGTNSADTGLDRVPDANVLDSKTDQIPDGTGRDAFNEADVPGRDITDTKDGDGRNLGHRSTGVLAIVVFMVLYVMIL